MYSFPSNLSGCYNDTQCASSTCTLTYDKGQHYWCNCKTYYNPLDGCVTNYYETLNPIISWTYFIISATLNIVCMGLLTTRVYYEINKWWHYRNVTIVPRSKFVTISAIILCCLVDIIALTLYKAGLSVADIIGKLSATIFTLCFIFTVYCLFTMMAKSNKLGNLQGVWRGLSLTIITIGTIGLTISWISGLIGDIFPNASISPILTLLITLVLSLTLTIVLSISIPVIIIMLVKFSQSNTKKTANIRILWRCAWIVVAMEIYTIVSLVILVLLSYFFPQQLFDVITLYKWTSQVLYMGGKFLYASFFLSMKVRMNKSKNISSSFKTETNTSKTSTTISMNDKLSSKDSKVSDDIVK